MTKSPLFVFLMILLLQVISSDNYVTFYYKGTQYIQYAQNAFFNDYRKKDDVSKIVLDGFYTVDISGSFYASCSSFAVHFSKAITTLAHYLDSVYDSNSLLIEHVDFSHFDSSEITSLEGLFKGCTSLKSVNMINFNTPQLTTMQDMFNGCSNLISVDLSSLTTSKVSNFQNLFKGCTNLKLMNIKGFEFYKQKLTGTFDGLDSIAYVVLNNVKYDSITLNDLRWSPLQKKKNLIVCQNEMVLTGDNGLIFFCCDFNAETSMCGPTDYKIKVIYSQDVEYSNGFQNDNRNLHYINHNGNTRLGGNGLNIIANKDLDIYFSGPINNLDSYFSSQYDSNAKFIKSIDFSGINSPDINNMINLFSGCESLNSIKFPNDIRFSISSIQYMFFGCKSLTSINLSNLNTESVTSMNSMFKDCSFLTSIDLSSFKTEKVTDMNSMFNGCSSLTSIDLSSFNTEKVTNMESMFEGCSSLKLLNLSNFYTRSLSGLTKIFYGCSELVLLDISNFNMANSYIFDNAFGNLNNLRYLDIYNIQPGQAFTNENDLNNINNLIVCQKDKIITNKNSKSICCSYDIEKKACDSINFIIVTYGKDTIYENGFINEFRNDVAFIKQGENLLQVSEKITIEKNTNIEIDFPLSLEGLSHFFDVVHDPLAANIISIDFSHLDSSSISDMSFLFKGLKLKSIDLSTLDLSSLKNIASMFENCDSLEEIKFPSNNVDSLNDISSLFAGCSSLTSVDLSSFNTASVTNMNSLFKDCTSMELIYIPNFITTSVTDMSLMFSGCTSLKMLDIDNFNMENVQSADNMFSDINNLKYIDIYYVENTNKYITDSYLKDINKLTVCQKENIITNEDVINKCCYFDPSKDECVSSNFIDIAFGEEVEYEEGFGRECTDFIIYGDYSQKSASDKLSIIQNTKLRIFISSSITSLESFFSIDKDKNVDKIVSIDLSRFDKSKIINIKSLFKGCKSLKQIDLSDLQTSSITDMSNLFSDCESLDIIDLTYFDTSLVTNMDKMFYNCANLKILEIPNFNMTKVESANDMFNSANNFKYINIYNIIDSKNYISNSYLKSYSNSLKVCQRNEIIKDKTNVCCYYDLSDSSCKSDNYIIIYFGENTKYNSGFENEFRNNILFIKNNLEHKNVIEQNKLLKIKKGTKIEVYFSSVSTSLTKFFSETNDENVKKITFINLSHLKTSSVNIMNFMFYGCSSLTSIDFTNFNTSLVTNMNYMFSGCSSLTSIDFSSFDTSKVIDMKYMFNGCKSLKSIDLSYFNTTSLIDMDHLFSNCASLELIDLSYFNTASVENMNSLFFKCTQLKVIDISNFDMKKVQSASNMFKDVTNLKYINLFHITDSYKFITDSNLKDINNLIVCQKEEIVQNKDIINKCCYYDIENEKCGSTSFILAYYGRDVNYPKGFAVNSKRQGIEHLINVDYKNKLSTTESFNVHKGAKLEIYFNSNEIYLDFFFSDSYDYNTLYILSIDFSYLYSSSIKSLYNLVNGCSALISIDLSNLNTSSVTDMSFMFYQCISLKSIDLSSFDTTLVTNMVNMLYQCSSLISVDLSSFNTPSLENMNGMFGLCTSLKSIDLSSFDTSLVAYMGGIFFKCTSLQSLDLSHFNFKSVVTFGAAFYEVTNLKYLNIFHVQDPNSLLKETDLNKINNLTVCQKEKIITNEEVNNACGYFNLETNKTESNNYIIIRYGNNAEYKFGFIKDKDNNNNKFRKNIEFITNTNPYKKLKDTDELILRRGSKLEIYFSSPLSSLEKFFDPEIDNGMKNAISIDLSHFDISLMNNMNSLFSNCVSLQKIYLPEEIKLKDQMIQIFYECNSLESVDLSCFDTSSVTDMHRLFYNCNTIKNLDLSSFDTKSTINMNEMFYGCSSLEVLDISSFNMEKVKENTNMFEGLSNLLYLNIYDVQNSYSNITDSILNKIDNLTVCQKEKLITNENIINKCCLIDIESNECDSDNFIILYYKEDCTYESGFNENKKRNGIKYIINGSKRNKINSDEKLVIKSGHKIEIYYENPIQTLENYFSINYDSNADKIEKIDLLNFDSSLVTDMSSMFLGCSSLKSVELSNFDTSLTIKMNFMFFGCSSLQIIDLSNFKTSLVTNMNYMFYGCISLESLILPQLDTSSVINMNSMFSGCSSLKSLDLSSFKTSSVTNMNYMFYDLSSLESLNITNFDMINVKYADNMFNGLNKLKYIDIYNVQNENKYISESDLNKNNKLTVCQKENIIKDKTSKCESEHTNTDNDDTNYIIVEYGKQTNYPNGFINNGNANNDYRKDIAIKYIIKESDQSKYDADKELNIEAGTRIQIHFSNPVTSFQSFFDSTYDTNAKNIEFIDFSNFISSSVTDISSLFKGCTSLKVVDMSNFDFKSIEQSSSLFSDANNLKYIILNDIQNYDENKLNLEQELNGISTLIVCQKDEIIKNNGYKYICCNYNIKNEECEYENSISLKFSEEAEYPNGFSYQTLGDINEIRKNNNFIIYLNDKKYEANEELVISKNSKLILQFISNATNLKDFFNVDNDENMVNIVSVDMSHLDLSSVTDMSYMFSGCTELENIDFSNMNAPLLTDISFIFNGCIKLKSVSFTNFKTPSLISMKAMFSDCGALKSIDVSNLNTSLVTNMNKLFYGCSSLTYIDASDFNTTLVTDMSYMFGGCSALKYIDISNFNFGNIQSAENMFNGADNLGYINIYNVEISYSDIIKNNLNNNNKLTVCQKETIITGDNINTKCCYYNLETKECDSTNYIIVKYGKDVEYNSGFIIDTYNGKVNEYRNDIEFIIYKDYTTKIKRADKLIISANSKIEIHFSTSLKSIQSFFSSNYDYNVENIISIDLTYLDTSSITDMNSFLLGCISLKSIDLSNKDLLNVKNMNLMFLGCNSLQSIILPNETISNIEKMNSMFLECSSLKSIDLSNLVTTSLTTMGKMFYRCQSLSSIDLSEFDTSLVIDMNAMFYKCDSLLYLDISNFDMTNTSSYDNMISLNNNIKYINLYEFKNDKILSEIFKNKKSFYVCQKELIITNPNAFNCCDFNFETDDCDYVGPSHSRSELPPMIDSTEGELIETTILDEPTTQYEVQTTETPTTESPTTQKPISPPIVKQETTAHIEPTTEKVKTTITATVPIVPTTIQSPIIPTTILKMNPTIPITSTKESNLILVGFDKFIKNPSWFSFFIYFISLINSVFPKNLNIQLTIINNPILKLLSDVEGNCTLQGNDADAKGQYLCQVETDTSNIKQIKLKNDFKFESKDNITVSSMTPLAKIYMDNIQNIGDKYDNLTNSTIYILDHSVYSKYGNLLFNITGIINGTQPNITSNNLVLMVNSASDSDDNTQIEVNCNIVDIIGNNYTLNCKSNEEIEGDLQSAISFIDNDILLVNFDENTNSEINLKTNITSNTRMGYYSRKNKNTGLNAGAIVGIILACAVPLISVITVMICCKKTNHDIPEMNESTIVTINKPKVDSTKI